MSNANVAAIVQLGNHVTPQAPWQMAGSYRTYLMLNGLSHSMTNAEVWMLLAVASNDWSVGGLNADGNAWGTHYHAPGALGGAATIGTNAPTDAVTVAYNAVATEHYGYALLGFTSKGSINAVASSAMAPQADDTTVPKVAWAHVTTNIETARLRFIDLVAAQQVASLSERNIENYYKSAGVEVNAAPIARVLSYLAPRVAIMVNLAAVQTRAATFDWLRYHISAASTAGLVQKFIDAAGAAMTIGANTRAAVAQAIATPWDKAATDAIPVSLIGFTAVFLREVGQYPPNTWYKGERAVAQLSVAQIDFVKRFAVAWRAVSATSGIDPAHPPVTMANLIAGVNASGLVPAAFAN